jgi:dihydrofolate reductase
MGKLILFNFVSLDGYFAGPRGELDWHTVDAEFHAFSETQLNKVDALLFGRKTYEQMAAFWPTAQAIFNARYGP